MKQPNVCKDQRIIQEIEDSRIDTFALLKTNNKEQETEMIGNYVHVNSGVVEYWCGRRGVSVYIIKRLQELYGAETMCMSGKEEEKLQ